jgi:hypothetical protein
MSPSVKQQDWRQWQMLSGSWHPGWMSLRGFGRLEEFQWSWMLPYGQQVACQCIANVIANVDKREVWVVEWLTKICHGGLVIHSPKVLGLGIVLFKDIHVRLWQYWWAPGVDGHCGGKRGMLSCDRRVKFLPACGGFVRGASVTAQTFRCWWGKAWLALMGWKYNEWVWENKSLV